MNPKDKRDKKIELQKLCRLYLIANIRFNSGAKVYLHKKITKLLVKNKYLNDWERQFEYENLVREKSREITDNLDKIYKINFGFEVVSDTKLKENSKDLADRLFNIYNL